MEHEQQISFSNEKYDGYNNVLIKDLEHRLELLKKEEKEIKKQIDDIQNSCDHEYKFECRGMHEDAYKCSKCGHDEWN